MFHRKPTNGYTIFKDTGSFLLNKERGILTDAPSKPLLVISLIVVAVLAVILVAVLVLIVVLIVLILVVVLIVVILIVVAVIVLIRHAKSSS